MVELAKDTPALLFSSETGGVTAFQTHLALLRPDTGRDLADLLLGEVSLSNVGQHAFWSAPAISGEQVFLTADIVQGPDEVHYGDRRFMISAYFPALNDPNYYLQDRYMTWRRYGLAPRPNVLASEKPEIIERLKRVVEANHTNQPRLTLSHPIR